MHTSNESMSLKSNLSRKQAENNVIFDSRLFFIRLQLYLIFLPEILNNMLALVVFSGVVFILHNRVQHLSFINYDTLFNNIIKHN